ncbi:MAG: hypothetical protein GX621_16155, partial [Pirellulaceae bacterium]|nr:hypothetical protein [Pirellulaceae bacterium]
MTLKGILATTFAAQDRKSLVLAVIIAAAALITIAGFHQQLVQDRVLLIMYLTGIMVAAYVLVKRRALALMELVVFAAVARTLLGVHLTAAPGISNHVMAVLSDITFWFVLLYLGWRLAAEAYRFQREEIRHEVRREVEAKAAAERGTALITASRDIRQPLTVIRTIIDGLLFEPDDAWSDSQHESLTDLDRHVSCLMVLVDNLLDYGQVEARKVNIRCEPVSVAELIEQCVASTHARAAKLGVEIRTHVQNDVGLVIADPIRLRQVVFTLLANAVDFSKDGGTVNLQVRKNEEHLMLSVRDTGRGVAEQEMKALFDPYREDTDDEWRIHASLGLSLAKRLVEIHGGTMTTDSVADSGTVFTIRLPLDATEYVAKHSPPSDSSSPTARTARSIDDFIPRARPERTTNSVPNKSRESAAKWLRASSEELEEEPTRILVADANPSVRRILRQWLSALDCEMVEAENGIEALEIAQSRPTPHLMLLD